MFVHVKSFRAQRHPVISVCHSSTWSMLSTACLIERTCVIAPTCFLSPRTHWPSASSRAADTKLPCVIDKCIWVGEASHMGAEVHLLFCLFVHRHLGHRIVCVFVHFFVLCYIGDAAWPCQQDKTAVVKQSQHSPLTAAVPLWFDLQTGFLLPMLAIL